MKTAVVKNGKTCPLFIRISGISIAVLFFIMAGAVSSSARENAMIVSVDTSLILQHHPALQEAQQKFQGEVQNLQSQLQEMSEEEQMAAQQMMQQQLQQLGEGLQMEALDKVRIEIARIAEEKGYSYVVDKSALIVGGGDITEEIMEAMGIGAMGIGE